MIELVFHIVRIFDDRADEDRGSDSEDDMPTGPARDIFSDGENDSDGAEVLPPGQHNFDLDEMPEDDDDDDDDDEEAFGAAVELDMGSSDEDDDEFDEMDLEGLDDDEELDEFGVEGESEDEDEDDEVDSAFASSDEGEDVEMDEETDPRLAHVRLNKKVGELGDDDDDEDEEGGEIMTNLEDDLTNEGFTLPAVDNGGEEEDFEHGTSLRDVENRMRWLVGVCMGKGEKVSNGVPGK